jgi:chemotaxis protein histidine kinase CheA
MTVVRTFYPDVRLKKILRESGGTTAEQAVRAATKNLESIREQCMAAIDEKIEEILALVSSDDENRFDTIYARANEVFGEAGAFGLNELSQAAHSLCSLLAQSPEEKRRVVAVKLHVDSMRALRHPGMAGDEKARAAVLAALRQLTAKVTAAA